MWAFILLVAVFKKWADVTLKFYSDQIHRLYLKSIFNKLIAIYTHPHFQQVLYEHRAKPVALDDLPPAAKDALSLDLQVLHWI